MASGTANRDNADWWRPWRERALSAEGRARRLRAIVVFQAAVIMIATWWLIGKYMGWLK